VIGDNVIIANGVQMGGHVRIGEGSVISGMTGIHQFVNVGCGSFIGGGLRVDKDVPPFSKALGEPLAWAGVNEIGLAKLGYGEKERRALKIFYRRLFESGSDAGLLELENSIDHATGFVEALRVFFRDHQRGLLGRRNAPGLPPR
jgi:UDP-N-acetylglucosamine acyltransferase